MDSKGNQLVKKRLLKFWVVLGLYGLPTGSATAIHPPLGFHCNGACNNDQLGEEDEEPRNESTRRPADTKLRSLVGYTQSVRHACLGWSGVHTCGIADIWSQECQASPNPPTQLVFIELNMVPHKQKTELARELMRREKKNEETGSHAKKTCLRETKTKEEVIGGRKDSKKI